VHERQREEREKLNLLQAETSGIAILDPEREKEIGLALEAQQRTETSLTERVDEIEKAIVWLTTIQGLKKEIAELADEASKLQSENEAFKPDREKLDRASRAASLDGAYAEIKAIRKQQADDRAALKAEEAALPGLEASAREQDESLKAAEQKTALAKEELKSAAPVLQKVRSLDQKIADQKKAVTEGEDVCKKDKAKIDADKQIQIKELKKRTQAHATLKLVEVYLEEHGRDEWLIGGLTGVEEQVNGLLSRQKELLQQETAQDRAAKALEQAKKSLDDCQKISGIRKQERQDVSKQIQLEQDALSRLLGDRLLREYRVEKDTLLREMVFLKKIAELEDHGPNWRMASLVRFAARPSTPSRRATSPFPMKSNERLTS
jgi:exonuclease SbcC